MNDFTTAIRRAASASVDPASDSISDQFWWRFIFNLGKELENPLDPAIGSSGLRLTFVEDGKEEKICEVACTRAEIQDVGESSPDPVSSVAFMAGELARA